MTRIYATAAIAATAAVLGVTGYMVLRGGGDDPFAPCRSSAVAGGIGSIGGPFTLVAPSGDTVTDIDVVTGPTLLYFGYSFCPDVCPLDNARNAQAVDILEEMGIEATPVFISVDPDRDSPEVMGDYAANMHPRMIGLTGSPEQVKAAAQAYRVYYAKVGDDPEYYNVDHSAYTYLALPGHGVVEFYVRQASPDELAASAACFVQAARSN